MVRGLTPSSVSLRGQPCMVYPLSFDRPAPYVPGQSGQRRGCALRYGVAASGEEIGSGRSHCRVVRKAAARAAHAATALDGGAAGAPALGRLGAVGWCRCSCAVMVCILLFVSDHAGRSVTLGVTAEGALPGEA